MYLNHSTNSNIWRCPFVKLPSHRCGTLHRQVSFLLSSTREMLLFNFLWICIPCSDTRDTYHFIIIIKVESFFTTDIIPSIPDDHKDKWYLHVYCISVSITMHPSAVQSQCTPATWRAVVLQRRTGNNKNVIFNLKTEETENVETSLQFLKLLYIFWPLGKRRLVIWTMFVWNFWVMF